VALAARGACDLGAGIQQIEDDNMRQALKKQARQVWWEALGMALALTLLTFLLSLVV